MRRHDHPDAGRSALGLPHAGADAAAVAAYREVLADAVAIAAHEARLRPTIDRCPDFVHAHLLWALLALADGRRADATARLEAVRSRSAARTRRERQLIELAQLAIAGRRLAVHGLSAEHLADHPDDGGLLTALAIAMAHDPPDRDHPA